MGHLYYIFIILLGNNFSPNKGLKTEKIIDGYLAEKNFLKYAAAIMYNPQEQNIPFQNPCTGAIISDWHVSTVAHCFCDKELGGFRNKEFYVAVSIVNLWHRLNTTRYITVDLVIIPKLYDPNTPDTFAKSGNLAVVKLVKKLGLHQGHRSLKKLKIARDEYIRGKQMLIVAGYGWNEINYVKNEEYGLIRHAYAGRSDGRLRFANASVINILFCQSEVLRSIIANGNICVKIRQATDERKGICHADSGAPLTRGDHLFGIAIHGFSDCNENRYPGVYLSVPYYHVFIINVLNDNRTEDMRVLQLQEKYANKFEFVEM